METTATTARLTGPGATISSLQGDAWEAWNASYAAPDRDVYRAVSLALYQQDMHQRISTLFARSDEQNARLESLMQGR